MKSALAHIPVVMDYGADIEWLQTASNKQHCRIIVVKKQGSGGRCRTRSFQCGRCALNAAAGSAGCYRGFGANRENPAPRHDTKGRKNVLGKNKETPFTIGLNGTTVEFYQAHWKAGTKGPFGLYPWHGKGFVRNSVQRGAVQAFLEGRPGNLQTFLANGFGVYDGECQDREILSQLIEGRDSAKAAAIISTAIAKFSKLETQKFLDEHLLNSVDGPNNRPELAAALLKV